jgi:hypothetical protein
MINLNLCKQINYFVLKITVEIYRIRICIQLEYKHTYKTIDREGHKNFKIILINSSIFSI